MRTGEQQRADRGVCATARREDIRVALITEGTYPYSRGGVSVWCDQIVSGLEGYRFDVHAIVADGGEQLAWAPPPNVDRIVTIPLWGRTPREPRRSSRVRGFPAVLDRLLVAIGPSGSGPAMVRVLQELHQFALAGQLRRALRSDESVEAVLAHLATYRTAGRTIGAPVKACTVGEAVEAIELLEHLLRPLASPVPRVDVCHSAANGLGALVALAANWQHGTPFVLTEHGIYLREYVLAHGPGVMSHSTRLLLLAFVRRLTQAAYSVADIVAPGSDYNRRWETVDGVDPARIRRIYNGIEPEIFPFADTEPVEPTLSWVGRINPLKDPKTLLRAFARVVAEMPEARLRIFGTAPKGDERYRDECEALLTDLGLEGSAVFEGWVADAADGYYAGQVVLLTSISEGFPYAVIEAMACGRPTVATDVGGVSEAVADPMLLVPPRDDSALAEVCLRLLRDPALRRDLSRRGRERALELFTVAACVEDYDQLYREMAAKATGSRHRLTPRLSRSTMHGGTAGRAITVVAS
jgi:glycosyltransferase involved in cell wall biosynthesis